MPSALLAAACTAACAHPSPPPPVVVAPPTASVPIAVSAAAPEAAHDAGTPTEAVALAAMVTGELVASLDDGHYELALDRFLISGSQAGWRSTR